MSFNKNKYQARRFRSLCPDSDYIQYGDGLAGVADAKLNVFDIT